MFITPSFKKSLIVAKNNFKGITLKKDQPCSHLQQSSLLWNFLILDYRYVRKMVKFRLKEDQNHQLHVQLY